MKAVITEDTIKNNTPDQLLEQFKTVLNNGINSIQFTDKQHGELVLNKNYSLDIPLSSTSVNVIQLKSTYVNLRDEKGNMVPDFSNYYHLNESELAILDFINAVSNGDYDLNKVKRTSRQEVYLSSGGDLTAIPNSNYLSVIVPIISSKLNMKIKLDTITEDLLYYTKILSGSSNIEEKRIENIKHELMMYFIFISLPVTYPKYNFLKWIIDHYSKYKYKIIEAEKEYLSSLKNYNQLYRK